MARRKVNKSASIREALAADPTRSAADIAKSLGVTPALVYSVKASMAKKAGKKPGRKPGAKAGAPQSVHKALDSAFEFVTKVGGLLNAEQLIAKLKAFKERF